MTHNSMISLYKSDDTFKMHQPFFKDGVLNYTEILVRKPYYALFYEFTAPYAVSSGILCVPDGCVDIIFVTNTDEPFMEFIGSPTSAKIVRGFSNCHYFGVRLKPGMYISYQDTSLKGITDNELFFSANIGILRNFFFKMRKCFTLQQRIDLFQDTFEPYVDGGSAGEITQHMLCSINSAKGRIHILELAEKLNYSERHISRIFQETMGISPKTFARIVRFQHALDMILSGDAARDNDYFMDLGYSDQAHFQREFKQYTGITPKNFMRSN